MTRIGRYCGTCLVLIELGREAGPCGGLEWLPPCPSCLARSAKRDAEVAKLEEIWRARTCAADDCDELFAPARAGQLYHDDRCRKRQHYRRKAAAPAG